MTIRANQIWTSNDSGAEYKVFSVRTGTYTRCQYNSLGLLFDRGTETGKVVSAYTFDLNEDGDGGKMEGKRCVWVKVPAVDFEKQFEQYPQGS
jgi:hypothetical protein